MSLLLRMMKMNVPFYDDAMCFMYKYRNRYLVQMIVETGIWTRIDPQFPMYLEMERYDDIKTRNAGYVGYSLHTQASE